MIFFLLRVNNVIRKYSYSHSSAPLAPSLGEVRFEEKENTFEVAKGNALI